MFKFWIGFLIFSAVASLLWVLLPWYGARKRRKRKLQDVYVLLERINGNGKGSFIGLDIKGYKIIDEDGGILMTKPFIYVAGKISPQEIARAEVYFKRQKPGAKITMLIDHKGQPAMLEN